MKRDIMSSFSLIDAGGTPTEIGVAHARATMHLREDVADWIEHVSGRHSLRDPEVRRHLTDAEKTLNRRAPGTLEQIAAMAEEFNLASEGLLLAVLGSYLDCLNGKPALSAHDADGCSTIAWSGSASNPVLGKNRDNNRRFLHMQTVLRVTPNKGNRWLALSTAGAPDAHSSGMNERGLAIADTHVPSRDVGPGLPRFTLMAQVLQECGDVTTALELLTDLPHMGFGNLILADATGAIATVESGYQSIQVRRKTDHHLAATNHFVHQKSVESMLQSSTSPQNIDSCQRLASMESKAAAASLRSDDLIESTKHILLDPTIWRDEADWLTTSTAIYSPQTLTMRLRITQPLHDAPFVLIPVILP